MQNLIYRRQFILGGQKLSPLSHWKKLRLNETKSNIYIHPDLEVTEIKNGEKRIILLGYIFDARNPQHTNYDTLNDLISVSNFEEFTRATYKFAGRFILIYRDSTLSTLLHDASGLREVYYTKKDDELWCGSQPSILAEFLNLRRSGNKALNSFCNSKEFRLRQKAWVGDGTVYDSVRHLMPNHYLDLASGESHRYWPDEPIEEMSINKAVEISGKYLEGFINCASERYELMQAVTSGWDTRVLLAASKGRKDEIYYFINKHKHLDEKSADIRVPRKLLEKLGLEFNIIEYPDTVDDEFREIFKNNVTLGREILLPAIYNVYYKRFPKKMNINGDASGVARNYFEKKKDVNSHMLAELAGYKNSEYAIQECGRWLEKSRKIAKGCNMNICDLFYWETRMGNWGALGSSETDIAVEEFSPFNCRELLITLLSVNAKYRDMHISRLYREMVKKMWKDALSEPVNPSVRSTLIRVLKTLRLYSISRYLHKKILSR